MKNCVLVTAELSKDNENWLKIKICCKEEVLKWYTLALSI